MSASETPPFVRAGDAAHAVIQGLAARLYSDMPAEVRAAVDAYDDARRAAYGCENEPPMSATNKATVAPMILAAVSAYLTSVNRNAA